MIKKKKLLNRVEPLQLDKEHQAQLFATPWTVAHQALLSMEFSRQECWSGLPFPSPTFLVTIGQFTLYPSLSSDFHIMDCFISS